MPTGCYDQTGVTPDACGYTNKYVPHLGTLEQCQDACLKVPGICFGIQYHEGTKNCDFIACLHLLALLPHHFESNAAGRMAFVGGHRHNLGKNGPDDKNRDTNLHGQHRT